MKIDKGITERADLAVIGAGSGGLSVAAGAAQMGARVVLVEKSRMGGDCLNYGCVPSKALIAAGKAAQTIRAGARFGVNGHEPGIDFAKVHEHVHGVIAAIAPHDSVERFEGLGVDVVQAWGRFVSSTEIEADGRTIRARRFVVATGSSPAVPPIPGLDSVPFLTNETVFDLTERPEHLTVIGAGPVGVELAQAHRRLGARVTLLDANEILARDDRDAAALVRERLVGEGVDLRERARIASVQPRGNGVNVILDTSAGEAEIEGTHLLIATGRRANVEGLALEKAGIQYSARGIAVDARLRSSNRRVFAIGDVVGDYQFTHVAGYQAGIVVRNALFGIPAKARYDAIPRVTYTDPELAQVGLTETQAIERYAGTSRVLRWTFVDNDRARAEHATDGFVKAVVGQRGRVLGATIVGRDAGELILPWVMAVHKGMRIGDLAGVVAPYPTLGETSKRVAGSYYTGALFGPSTRRIVRFLQRLLP